MESQQSRVCRLPVRVPYADVDPMGVVYYANYLVYFEMARSQLLREAGVPYGEIERRGIRLPVIEAHCEYRRGACFDDLITVEVRCTDVRGVRLRMDYEVTRGAERLAAGYTVHVCVSPDGRPMRPAGELKALAPPAARLRGGRESQTP